MKIALPYRLNKNSTAEEVATILNRLKDYMEKGIDEDNFREVAKGGGLDDVESSYTLSTFSFIDDGLNTLEGASYPYGWVNVPNEGIYLNTAVYYATGLGIFFADDVTVQIDSTLKVVAVSGLTDGDDTFHNIPASEPGGDAFTANIRAYDEALSDPGKYSLVAFVRTLLEV